MFEFIKKFFNMKSKDTSVLTHEKQLDKDIHRINIANSQNTKKQFQLLR